MKRNVFLLAFIYVILAGLSGGLDAQTQWVPYIGNPLFDPAVFDPAATSMYSPAVHYDGTLYRLWYTRKSAGATEKIGYATSPDGKVWTLIDSNCIIPSTDPTRFDYAKVGQPAVIKTGDTLKMWYWGNSSLGNCIGYAWSLNGSAWTKVDGPGAGKSVLDVTIDGSGAFGLNTPSVIKDGASYKMWYSRLNVSGGVSFRMAYATSPDGIVWTNVAGSGTAGAVIDLSAGAFDEYAVYFPCVIKNNSTYQMWYTGNDVPSLSGFGRIGYATSTDGIAWNKFNGSAAENSILDSAMCPTVLLSGNVYTMWYFTTLGLMQANSQDNVGLQTTTSENSFVNIYPNPPRETLHFTTETEANYSAFLYDVSGRLLLSESFMGREGAMNISALKNGVYLLILNSEKGRHSARILKTE